MGSQEEAGQGGEEEEDGDVDEGRDLKAWIKAKSRQNQGVYIQRKRGAGFEKGYLDGMFVSLGGGEWKEGEIAFLYDRDTSHDSLSLSLGWGYTKKEASLFLGIIETRRRRTFDTTIRVEWVDGWMDEQAKHTPGHR